MAKRKVFIAIGHGGSDPGAVSGKLREKDLNLPIALKQRDELVRHGVDVCMSRTKDENDPMSDEVKECNAYDPEVVIADHVNASGTGKGDGAEAWVPHGDNDSKALARDILTNLESVGQNSRGVKTKTLANGQDYLGFIRGTRKKGRKVVLVEYAFIDNKEDIKIIDTKAEQEVMGIETAKAILKHLGIKYVKEKAVKYYCCQVGAFLTRANSEKQLAKLKAAGFNGYITKSGLYYKCQVGAFSVKNNANNMLNKLKKAGFNSYITIKK
jgi:N-acetylmuramoyl-L-alanine amidase